MTTGLKGTGKYEEKCKEVGLSIRTEENPGPVTGGKK
jgi:hypothetical protein